MKRYFLLPSLVVVGLMFSSCKSTITAQKVVKQEEKAREELSDAHEELVKLAQMKEQYSVDGIQTQIDALKKRQKEIKKDIKKLEGVSTDAAKDGTGGLVKNLEKESASLGKKISDLEGMPKENWAKAIEAINQSVANLEQQIATITQNLDRSAE